MLSVKSLVRIALSLLAFSGIASAFFVAGIPFIEDRIDETISAGLDDAVAAVMPVIAELYPTPTAGEIDPRFPPVPNIEAARARFVEGGELLPGGRKLCLRPDGSGAVLAAEFFEKYCPAELR